MIKEVIAKARRTKQPKSLASLYEKITPPPCFAMCSLASAKKPAGRMSDISSDVDSISAVLAFVSTRRAYKFLTGCDSNTMCSKSIAADATAIYAGMIRVLDQNLGEKYNAFSVVG